MFNARPVLIVGAATALSRILGFVRDILIAAVLGTGAVADAFLVAFRLPNLFRRLLGEGALNAAFIPIHARLRTEGGPAAAHQFVRHAAAVAACGVTLLTLAGIMLAPGLVQALAPGFADDPAKFALAVDCTRLAFPFVAFAVLAALLTAALNADSRFAAAAAAPIVVNGVLVALLLWLVVSGRAADEAARLLAFGVAVAGAAQVLWLIAALLRAPVGWPFARPRWTPDLKRLALHAGPGIVAGGATQLAVVVATQVASTLPGGVSWLYYADRITQLPLGFVAVAMGTVLLPDLAGRVAAQDQAAERDIINRACAFGLLLALPASAGLWVLADPIVAVLFERAAFGPADSRATADALRWLALGLPGAVLGRVLVQPFFARERLVIPVASALAMVALTGLGGWLLLDRMGVAGVALALSAASTLQAGLLGALLWHRRIARPDGELVWAVAGMAAAGLIMAAAVSVSADLMQPWLQPALSFAFKGPVLAALCLGGALIYVAAAYLFRVPDARLLGRQLRSASGQPDRH